MRRIENLKVILKKRGFDNDYQRIAWLKILHQELKLITSREFFVMLQHVAGPDNYILNDGVGHFSYKKNEFQNEFILFHPNYIQSLKIERENAKNIINLF